MKIKKRSKYSTRNAVIVLIILLLLVGALFAFKFNARSSSDNKPDSNISKEDKKKRDSEDEESKKDFIEESQGKTDTVQQPQQKEDKVGSASLSAEQQGDSVVVTTKLIGFPDGTCTLTATNGSAKKSYPAEILYQPEYSICTGFSIPKSDLGPGNWSLNLTANGSNGLSRTASTSIGVK